MVIAGFGGEVVAWGWKKQQTLGHFLVEGRLVERLEGEEEEEEVAEGEVLQQLEVGAQRSQRLQGAQGVLQLQLVVLVQT